MADIPAGTTLFRYFEMDIERPDVPNVEAWYVWLRQRPAYQEHGCCRSRTCLVGTPISATLPRLIRYRSRAVS
jgi:hypothetical protein